MDTITIHDFHGAKSLAAARTGKVCWVLECGPTEQFWEFKTQHKLFMAMDAIVEAIVTTPGGKEIPMAEFVDIAEAHFRGMGDGKGYSR